MIVLYSPDWTNTGFSFILLTVNLFRHSTLTEQGLYHFCRKPLQFCHYVNNVVIDVLTVDQ